MGFVLILGKLTDLNPRAGFCEDWVSVDKTPIITNY